MTHIVAHFNLSLFAFLESCRAFFYNRYLHKYSKHEKQITLTLTVPLAFRGIPVYFW